MSFFFYKQCHNELHGLTIPKGMDLFMNTCFMNIIAIKHGERFNFKKHIEQVNKGNVQTIVPLYLALEISR